MILANVLVQSNDILGEELMAKYPRLFGAGVEGSRSMLAAIATSLISVAGVIFFITVVAVTLVSNQF